MIHVTWKRRGRRLELGPVTAVTGGPGSGKSLLLEDLYDAVADVTPSSADGGVLYESSEVAVAASEPVTCTISRCRDDEVDTSLTCAALADDFPAFLSTLVPGIQRVRRRGLGIERADGTTVRWEHASGTERSAAVFAGQLFSDTLDQEGGNDHAYSEGIVLIDDSDLPWHPVHRRGLAARLRTLLPEATIVLATSCDLVVQGCVAVGGTVVALSTAGVVHGCCGCSCHVCDGMHTGGRHTTECMERSVREAGL